MSTPQKPLLKVQNDRLIFRERDHIWGCLPVIWVGLMLVLGLASLLGIGAMLSGNLGYHGAKHYTGVFLAFVVVGAFPLLFTGGFEVNRSTKKARRFGQSFFPLEGAGGIGLRHEMRRVLIKGHHDEVHEYCLFFPMWNDTEHKLYTTGEKDRALQLQKELADHLQLEALPMEKAPKPESRAL